MKIYFLLFMTLLYSCAKPNYVDPANLKEQNNSGQSSCPIYFEEERLCLSMNWTTFPSEESVGTFVMKFYAEDAPEILVTPHYTPFVKLWMPSMGHGSSPVTVTKIAEGTYEVSEVYFIMLGEWEIRYQLKNNEDVIEEQIQNITL